MSRLYSLVRNFLCGSIAVGVIASGRVSRAKARALNSDVVTSIYFHNPNKRLFARCVEWLAGNGYTFISANDLIDILHRGSKPPKGAVWLSFDDGFKELLETVLPLTRQRKTPITVFIPSGVVELDGLFPWLHHKGSAATPGRGASVENGMRDSMTVADVKEIARYPEVTVGSHTVNHTVTSQLADERARFEFGESKRALESWTFCGCGEMIAQLSEQTDFVAIK